MEDCKESEATKTQCETQEPRITNTKREKDPRRVEAGKRLGAISKMAKERKRECEERESRERRRDDNDDNDSEANTSSGSYLDKINPTMILVGLGVVFGLYLLTRKTG